MMSQLKVLEEDNRRLKRMHADLSMQADLLKEALGKKVWSAPALQGFLTAVERSLRKMYPASREWTAVAVRP